MGTTAAVPKQSLTGFLTKAIDTLEVAAHRKLDDKEKAEWGKQLRGMAQDHGPVKARAALDLALRESKSAENGYLPSFGEVWSRVEKAEVHREYCRRCRDNEGWIYVMVDGEKKARALKCKHDPPTGYVSVTIGPHSGSERRTVRAMVVE